MKLKTVKKIRSGVLAVCCIFILLFMLTEETAFAWTVVGLILPVLIFDIAFWRCPYCDKYFGRLDMGNKVKYCPFCGEEIDLESDERGA